MYDCMTTQGFRCHIKEFFVSSVLLADMSNCEHFYTTYYNLFTQSDGQTAFSSLESPLFPFLAVSFGSCGVCTIYCVSCFLLLCRQSH